MSRATLPETAVSARGVVAAPHSAAAETGRAILAEGGNAYEAMIAMAATIAVVMPHMNAIGGDGFWLAREPSGSVHYVEATGYAGAGATIGFYRDRGHETAIPPRGPLAALTVPGAIGGWIRALAMARGVGGRLPLDVLLADAQRLAREGVGVSLSEWEIAPKRFEDLAAAPGYAGHFLQEGKRVEAGALRRQPALAATLEQLVHAGLDDFYRGDIAREMAADLERIGSPVTRDDLRRFEARERKPLALDLKSGTFYDSPPPTQGLATLLTLGIAERLDLGRAESSRFVHALVEATKRAFAIRDTVVTDFDELSADPSSFLEPKRLEREAARIAYDRAAPFPATEAEGDTVYMAAIDGAGRAVSYIQSIFWEWGSGCVLPSTGVLLQNRGTAFSLDPGHLLALRPGKRPFHTLNPGLVALRDGRVIAYGTMGGEGQPQTKAAIIVRHLGFDMPIAEAVAAPRWRLGRSWGDAETSLAIEERFDGRVLEELEQLGHAVRTVGDFSHELGHAGMIVRYPDGRIEGVHDPRSDGGALGV